MLDMLHLLTVVCLFAAAWLISRAAAYVARKVLLWHDRHTEAAAATVVAPLEEARVPVVTGPAAASVSPLLPMTGPNDASSAPKTLLHRPRVIAARKKTTLSKTSCE